MPTIAEDLSSPLPVYNVGSSGQSATTAKFSPPGQSLLVAMIVVHTVSGVPALTVTDTGNHTWTQKVAVGSISAIYEAPVGTAPGPITVTAVNTAGEEAILGMMVRVLTGASATQSSVALAGDASAGNLSPQGQITPTVLQSWIYCCAVMGGMQPVANPLALTTLTLANYQDQVEGTCILFGRQVNPSVSLTPVTLGWSVTIPHTWSLCLLEVYAGDVPVTSSDTGHGSDATVPKVTAHPGTGDAGTGSERTLPIGAFSFISSADTGSGNDLHPGAVISNTWLNLGSTDTGSGYEVYAGPPIVHLTGAEFAAGTDLSSVPYSYTPISAIVLGFAQEGFSLDRVSVLATGTGAESAQLYGAQSVTLVPNVTSSDMQADDDEYGTWYNLDKAALTVVNGYMSFAVISQLSGLTVASSGTSPHDYYGLPLWTQYQHNKPSVPLAFRMMGRNSNGFVRTLTFVLYNVQLSVLDFDGTVYKTGLGVSYAGTVLYGSTDEYGTVLPAGPQIGRIVSVPGNQFGAVLPQFPGV